MNKSIFDFYWRAPNAFPSAALCTTCPSRIQTISQRQIDPAFSCRAFGQTFGTVILT